MTELIDQAYNSGEPQIVTPTKVNTGGVDPLGLRQINFGLMDRVLPDLNNVARHVRPYVLMAWAWRRARFVVEHEELGGADDFEMRDFVDRIEAIYAWSQFLANPRSDIPGSQAMRALLDEESYHFGGREWETRRDMRRHSTGLISPLNYGPSLRTMRWLLPVEGGIGIFQPDRELDPILDEFENGISKELHHDVFSHFGPVTVKRQDVERWGKLWNLSAPSSMEAEAMFTRLGGAGAPTERRDGVSLIQAAYADLGGDEPATADEVRLRMADLELSWVNPACRPSAADAWREIQLRQLFRLALEALLHWIIGKLLPTPLSSAQLASKFLEECEEVAPFPKTASDWMQGDGKRENPVKLLAELQSALRERKKLAKPIHEGIALCLREARNVGHSFENPDRLPLSRAKTEAQAWEQLSPVDFLVRVIEVWIMSQHAYWAVGRGLADARSRGKSILRLKVVMDDGGWTLTPGTTKQGNPPEPTPDRLETALSLLHECHQLG